MAQAAAELGIPAAGLTMDSVQLRTLAGVSRTPGTPWQLSSLYGKSCSSHIVLLGNSPSAPGFVNGVWGAINPTTFRGNVIGQFAQNLSGFNFAFSVTGVFAQTFFRTIMFPAGPVPDQTPAYFLDALSASSFSSGPSVTTWWWNGAVPPWGSYANGTVFNAQIVW